jgi:predicted TIM-barrel fold metal-dependent hydrolase
MPARALIDTNVFWGSWPFSIAPNLSARDLAAHLARRGVRRALVSPLGAVLQPDPMPANRALCAAVRRLPALIAVPILNPMLATWREQLDDSRRDARPLRAIRILPNYHNYSLRSSRLAEFMSALEEKKTRVILNVRLEDERQSYFALRIKGVPLAEIVYFLKQFPHQSILLAGCYQAELEWLAGQCKNFSAELSFAEAPDTVRALGRKIPLRRLMFGSATPLLSLAAQSAKIRHTELPSASVAFVAHKNARRFFSI